MAIINSDLIASGGGIAEGYYRFYPIIAKQTRSYSYKTTVAIGVHSYSYADKTFDVGYMKGQCVTAGFSGDYYILGVNGYVKVGSYANKTFSFINASFEQYCFSDQPDSLRLMVLYGKIDNEYYPLVTLSSIVGEYAPFNSVGYMSSETVAIPSTPVEYIDSTSDVVPFSLEKGNATHGERAGVSMNLLSLRPIYNWQIYSPKIPSGTDGTILMSST